MRTSFLALLVALVATSIAAPAASAKTAPCLPGIPGSPKCTVWEAKVAVVDDGDTVQARVKKGKKLLPRQSVRINGLQAPELHSYSRKQGRKGDCYSVEATERLESLINNKWVRLTAQKSSSTTTGEGGRIRARRSISMLRGGKWTDVGAIMMAEGYGLPFPNGNEWASNAPYRKLAQEAAAAGKGIWNPTNCGVGPSPDNPISLKLKWDAEDDDAKNINGEWIRITNGGATPLPLAGWSLRDSHFRGPQKGANKGKGYMFPSGTEVPAGGSIRVHVGRGSNSDRELYWGLGETIFENATNDKKAAGDGAFLVDPKGNVRAYTIYPCVASCSEPLKGAVEVIARYQGGVQPGTGQINEWITIKNVSGGPVSLDGYELESVPWFYEFDAGDVIEPGKSLVLWIDKPYKTVPANPGAVLKVPVLAGAGPFKDAQDGGFRSWNFNVALLGDGKDVVTLRNPAGEPVACDAWGGERCPSI